MNRRTLAAALMAWLTLAAPAAEQPDKPMTPDALRTLAEQGDPHVQHILGLAYLHGTHAPTDYPKALECFRKAAAQGHAPAQISLGAMHAKGQGVPRSLARAAYWLHKAALQGEPAAQALLASLYTLGRGVPKDLVEAHAWLTLAAAAKDKIGANARERLPDLQAVMTREQITEAQALAAELQKCIKQPPCSLVRLSH